MVYTFYRAKEITIKVYNSVIKSIQIQQMHITFMNSENSKTSHPQRLLFNLTDKINLQRGEKIVPLSYFCIHRKT